MLSHPYQPQYMHKYNLKYTLATIYTEEISPKPLTCPGTCCHMPILAHALMAALNAMTCSSKDQTNPSQLIPRSRKTNRNGLINHGPNHTEAQLNQFSMPEINRSGEMWFQPIWKILVKLDHFPRDRGENNKIFETTTQEILKLQLTNSPNYVRLHLPLRQPSEQVERFLPLGGTIISAKQCTLIGQGIDTVDGRDPAPVVNIPLFTGFQITCQVVQDGPPINSIFAL